MHFCFSIFCTFKNDLVTLMGDVSHIAPLLNVEDMFPFYDSGV